MRHWNNVLLAEHDTAFFLAAKSANSSIKAALKSAMGLSTDPDGLHRGWDYRSPCELQAVGHRFGFVRHPIARAVSCYYQKIIGTGRSALFLKGFWRGMSWEQFVEVVCATPDEIADLHIQSQHHGMTCRGRVVPRIWRIEELNWADVQSACPFALPDLDHRNANPHPDWRDMPHARLLDRYRADLDEWYA